jgi:Uncharacterized conserved protein
MSDKGGMLVKAIGISDDFIKLGQLLKLADMVSSGVEAKIVIQNGEVKVNGEVDTRRGKKIYPQDIVEYKGKQVTVIGE